MSCYRKTNYGSPTLLDTTNVAVFCKGYQAADGFYPCCAKGTTCLDGGLCYTANPPVGGSGFFVAACSDPTYKSPACNPKCTALHAPDVVYNYTSNLWACCDATLCSGPNCPAITCPNHTNQTFQAPPPSQLLAQIASSSVTSSSATSASSAGTSSTSTASTISTGSSLTSGVATTSQTSSVPPSSPSELSTGAKAGIGVGVTIGVILLIAIGFCIYRNSRRKRVTRQPESQVPEPLRQPQPYGYGSKPELDSSPNLNGVQGSPGMIHELPVSIRNAEQSLKSNRVQELSG